MEAGAALPTVEVIKVILVEVIETGLGVVLGPVTVGLIPAAEHSMDCNKTAARN